MTRLIAAVLLFSLGPSALAQRRDLKAEIQAVNDSMVAAFNSGDLRAVARFYTVGGHRDSPWQAGRSTLVEGGPNGDRASIVEFLAIWRRDATGGVRLAVDYYRH
jgi:hypothetical protein